MSPSIHSLLTRYAVSIRSRSATLASTAEVSAGILARFHVSTGTVPDTSNASASHRESTASVRTAS